MCARALCIAGLSLFLNAGGIVRAGDQAQAAAAASIQPKVDTGDTAWVLISAALVMLMTP
jgi:hypothetical protein